jgi:subfamily B ATP-binding cassette protein MsbA
MLALMFFVSGAFAAIIAGFKPLIDILIGDFDAAQYQQQYEILQHPTLTQVLRTLQDFVTKDRMLAMGIVAVFLLVMQVFRGLCEMLQLYLANYASGRVEIDLTTELQGKLLEQPLGFFETYGTSGIITIAWNDTQALVRGLNLILSRMLQQPLNIAAAVMVALAINWKIASLAFVGVPLSAFGASRFARYARRRASLAFKDIALTLGILQEEFYGLKILKAFTMEEQERVRFRHAMGRLFRNRMRIVKAKGWNSPLTETMGAIGVVLLLTLGAREVIAERMSPASLFVLFAAIGATYQPIKTLSKAYADVQTILASADRVFTLMDVVPYVTDAPDAIEMPRARGEIGFEGVYFSYNAEDLVLNNINVQIKAGETVALVGYSGAGKTTFANLIMRFYDMNMGRITIDDYDLRDVTQKSLRRNIGLVTQETVLFDGTVAQNIAALSNNIDRERVITAAKVANAHEFITELEQGYDAKIGERGGKLSGGQQQRLAIARTVYKDPPVFILDEATSSLDSYNEELVQEALGRLMMGRTTIIIAHRFSTITFADRIIVLNKGEIEITGTLQECLEQSETFRILYEKQFSGLELPSKG